MHADGSGTKAVLAYLKWKRTKDLSVWKGIAQDCFVMNLDDILCSGFTESIEVSMSIDRNKFLISGEVIATIIEECQRLCEWVTRLGIPCIYMGGETADVGNAVRTIVINNTFRASVPIIDVINAGNIGAPAFIVGFSSTGQASYEDRPNSGIRSNGLTNAIHDALCPEYRADTETYSPEVDIDLIYRGSNR
ncbi:MAG TPA: AIR synthase related protein, partial [Spirochaetota bacterium]